MKKVYCVTYSYTGSASDYAGLFDELKTFRGWWHYIDGTWLITSDEGAKGIMKRLQPHLDKNINLLVIEVGNERSGWLPRKAWDWMKKNLPKSPSS